MNSAKCSMSASVTVRGPATTLSPIRSSASDLRNGCTPVGLLRRAGHPAAGDRAEHPRAGLHGGALHVVQHAAHAAHLLAAAGPAGAAVHQRRQRRAVPGRLARRRRRRAPAAGRATARAPSTTSRAKSASPVTTEPARLPWPRAASSMTSLRAAVAEHRADRAERLDLVRLGPVGVVAAQQHRRQERAALGVGADDVDLVRVAEHERAGRLQRLQRAAHLLALLQAGQRAHPRRLVGRVADDDLRQPRGHGLDDRVHAVGGHERAPDRGALLPGLDGHLGDQLLDVQVELRRARARRPGRGSSSSASRPRR